MVSVDSQGHDHEEVEPILRERLHMQTKVEVLTAGDFAFEGNTNQGLGMIGVERKRLKDILGSMRSGRLVGEQLPKMFEHYDFSYLIVEGVMRANPQTGVLEEGVTKGANVWWRTVELGRSRFLWQDLNHYLTTLEHSRIRVRQTDDPMGTAYTIRSLYTWYRDKDWSQHKSLKQLWSTPMPTISLEDKTGLVRRVAKEFSGIGADKSLSVALKFRSVREMVLADPGDWMSIPGIGAGISKKVTDEINGVGEERPYGAEE